MLRSVTLNRFPIKKLVIDSLLVSPVKLFKYFLINDLGA